MSKLIIMCKIDVEISSMHIWTEFAFYLPICHSFFQSIQDMGNTNGRRLYEANLPESFRRPQTDQYPSLWADTLNLNMSYCLYQSYSYLSCLLPIFLLTLTLEQWNSSSGINMRRRNTTARMWPMEAVYVLWVTFSDLYACLFKKLWKHFNRLFVKLFFLLFILSLFSFPAKRC